MEQSAIQTILLIIGIATLAVTLYRFIYFIYPYIRPSSINKYLHSGSYALVTGATDGIGKALAIELAARGFNIILHGRNLNKLAVVSNEIQAVHPSRDVVSLLQDGSKNPILDISSIRHLPVSVLVNNVGVGPVAELEQFSIEQIAETVNLNALFPTHVTHSVLPQMSRPALPVFSYWHKFAGSPWEINLDLPARFLLRRQILANGLLSFGTEVVQSTLLRRIDDPLPLQGGFAIKDIDLKNGLTLEYPVFRKMLLGCSGGLLYTPTYRVQDPGKSYNTYVIGMKRNPGPYFNINLSLLR